MRVLECQVCVFRMFLQGEDGDDTNMVAEILLQFKENLSVHPGKRYTTRTVTGAQLCRFANVDMRQVRVACRLHGQLYLDNLQNACSSTPTGSRYLQGPAQQTASTSECQQHSSLTDRTEVCTCKDSTIVSKIKEPLPQ